MSEWNKINNFPREKLPPIHQCLVLFDPRFFTNKQKWKN